MIHCRDCSYWVGGCCHRRSPKCVSTNISNTKYERMWPETAEGDECGEGDDDEISTRAPSGKCKITNIYVDPDTGKVIVRYDDVPV